MTFDIEASADGPGLRIAVRAEGKTRIYALPACDQADFLVAFYQHSYEAHIAALRPGGVLYVGVPMAATLTQERFTGDDWIFERKMDGIRLLAFRDGSRPATVMQQIAKGYTPEQIEQLAAYFSSLPRVAP